MVSPEDASGVLCMVEVVVELKAKLVQIDAKMEEPRREIVVFGNQKAAFENYDPGFAPAAPPSTPVVRLHGRPQAVESPNLSGQEQPPYRARHSAAFRSSGDHGAESDEAAPLFRDHPGNRMHPVRATRATGLFVASEKVYLHEPRLTFSLKKV
jgi:hypothetical protein